MEMCVEADMRVTLWASLLGKAEKKTQGLSILPYHGNYENEDSES